MFKERLQEILERYEAESDLAEEVSCLFAEVMAMGGGTDTLVPTLPPRRLPGGSTVDMLSLSGEIGDTGDFENAVTIPPSLSPLGIHGRYESIGSLGQGGMGTVYRTMDRELNRVVAMKVAHLDLMSHNGVVSKFVEEAQVGAQLQHPNIIPVHDLGKLPDGRLYFTMHEIRGREFARAIEEVHFAVREQQWFISHGGWSLHRLVDVLLKVCEAMAYAHSKGVVHRDLKPGNIMLGPFGEVLVVDWGIAKIRDSSPDGEAEIVVTSRSRDGVDTGMGRVTGTPAYMAPEQATGRIDLIDHRADIYALGALLYEILSGEVPFVGPSAAIVLEKVLKGPPDSLRQLCESDGQIYFSLHGPPLPEALVGACEKAMAREADDRFSSAKEFSAVLRGWLDGAKRRDDALKMVSLAQSKGREADELRQQAILYRNEALDVLSRLASWDPEDRKKEVWTRQDEANVLDQEAQLRIIEKEQLLHAALSIKEELPEAHESLAAHYRALHEWAEAGRRTGTASRLEVRFRRHASALPKSHPDREGHFRYLSGKGWLSLRTEPGAEAWLERYELRNRRMVPEERHCLGVAPLCEVPMEMGSYRLRIRKAGCIDMLYPVLIERRKHWDGLGPDDLPVSLPLFTEGALGPDDVYVPAGWYWSGGDGQALNGLPRRRIWLDGFVMRRHPVTNREYLQFLNHLVAEGRKEEAMTLVPREPQRKTAVGEVLYIFKDGTFRLPPRRSLGPDIPVCYVDWIGAASFAEWEAERTGQAWRLPDELEWEKSARGVDGRYFPWGEAADPSWACMRLSHSGKPRPVPVGSYPIDCSPYGVLGMAGNMGDWTIGAYREEGPVLDGNRAVIRTDGDGWREHVVMGGSWNATERYLRSSSRGSFEMRHRAHMIGFRLCRSLAGNE
jgi:eukaryotic-like serine/threonine-protein kinase